MADLATLQQAIDEKRIDTRQLSDEQKVALNDAFESGELKGYKNLGQYESLINLGAMSVAQGKMKRLKPFEEATGIDRGDAVLAGSLGFSMLPYLKEKAHTYLLHLNHNVGTDQLIRDQFYLLILGITEIYDDAATAKKVQTIHNTK